MRKLTSLTCMPKNYGNNNNNDNNNNNNNNNNDNFHKTSQGILQEKESIKQAKTIK